MRRAIVKILTLVLAFGVAFAAAALPAGAQILQGDRFITAMKDNTVSGTTSSGAVYNLYFLPGGTVTYRDTGGHRDSGSWRLDRAGDVCVSWHGADAPPAGCYRVTAKGSSLSWWNKSASSGDTLRGTVTNAFLTAR
jgi:hypothetical protein